MTHPIDSKPSEKELSEDCRDEKCNSLHENIVCRLVKLSEDCSSSPEENRTCLDGWSMSERCKQQSPSESLDENGRHYLFKLIC